MGRSDRIGEVLARGDDASAVMALRVAASTSRYLPSLGGTDASVDGRDAPGHDGTGVVPSRRQRRAAAEVETAAAIDDFGGRHNLPAVMAARVAAIYVLLAA